jgi:hypothetical protein
MPPPHKEQKEDEVPTVIENDNSFIRSAYRNAEDFQSFMRHGMAIPLHKLHAPDFQYDTTYSTQVEMVA